MALTTRTLAFAFGSLALCAAAFTSAPAGAASITERLAVAPAADAGQPVEMQRRGGGFRGGFRGGGFRGGFRGGGFRGGMGGGGFRGGFRGGGPRFAGPRFGGGPRWGGPRPGWVRPFPGPRYRYGWRRPWVAPLLIAPPLAAGVWAGGNCRRVLRYNRWGEPFWVTRCCRVVIDYDGFRRRICRRV